MPTRGALAVATLLVVSALAGQASGASGSAKAGEHFLPPPIPSSARELAGLEAHPFVLVALYRGSGAEPLVEAAGGKLVSERLALWRMPGAAAGELVEQLVVRGALRYVEPDQAMTRIAGLPAEPFIGDQGWWLAAIGADLVDPPGPGVPVTIVDTGLDPNHPEFANRPDLTFLNNQVFTGEVEDHGTGVASVAAAPVNGVGIAGVYPQASLRIYDAGDATLSCSDTSTRRSRAAVPASSTGALGVRRRALRRTRSSRPHSVQDPSSSRRRGTSSRKGIRSSILPPSTTS